MTTDHPLHREVKCTDCGTWKRFVSMVVCERCSPNWKTIDKDRMNNSLLCSQCVEREHHDHGDHKYAHEVENGVRVRELNDYFERRERELAELLQNIVDYHHSLKELVLTTHQNSGRRDSNFHRRFYDNLMEMEQEVGQMTLRTTDVVNGCNGLVGALKGIDSRFDAKFSQLDTCRPTFPSISPVSGQVQNSALENRQSRAPSAQRPSREHQNRHPSRPPRRSQSRPSPSVQPNGNLNIRSRAPYRSQSRPPFQFNGIQRSFSQINLYAGPSASSAALQNPPAARQSRADTRNANRNGPHAQPRWPSRPNRGDHIHMNASSGGPDPQFFLRRPAKTIHEPTFVKSPTVDFARMDIDEERTIILENVSGKILKFEVKLPKGNSGRNLPLNIFIKPINGNIGENECGQIEVTKTREDYKYEEMWFSIVVREHAKALPFQTIVFGCEMC